ncbi:MAG: acyl-CoA dehydrogenase, partial [Jatrophihabitantaceae bacterium]
MDGVELPAWSDALLAGARAAGEDVAAGVELARKYGSALPQPGAGATATRWQLLAAVAAQDLTAARILEAHSDALAILAEAGDRQSEGTWGVFAAEAPGGRLTATDVGDGSWLDGTKPWCSLAGHLDGALVTAHVGASRGLFAVDLRHPSVRVEAASVWVSRGLRTVTSAPVHFEHTPARPVGAPGWYLTRPGFAWGGMGVAACWFGASTALAETLRTAAARKGGDVAALHVGVVDVALHAAAATLLQAAR